jgi:hypothetical protein
MPLFDKNSLDALKNKVVEEQTKAQKELSAEADAKARHAANRSEIISQLRRMAPELVSAAKSVGVKGYEVEIKAGWLGRKTETRWRFEWSFSDTGSGNSKQLCVNGNGQLLDGYYLRPIENDADIDRDSNLESLVNRLADILDKSSKKYTSEQIVRKFYRVLIEDCVQPAERSRGGEFNLIYSVIKEFK